MYKQDLARALSCIRSYDLEMNNIVPIGCENSSVRYFSASSPFACAVDIIEYSVALDFAPFAVFENSQFFLPTANGLIEFSVLLLSIGTSPFSRKV